MEVNSHRQRHRELNECTDEEDFENGAGATDEKNQSRTGQFISLYLQQARSVLVCEVGREGSGDAGGDHAQVETELRKSRLESDVVVSGVAVPHGPPIR